ncbi:hypothetical protein LPJ56_002108 [Coemansia sp. RSA 2599]|nr:hypothetical protein LPJ56_002108 [Coemansia sp. RSA 2599]
MDVTRDNFAKALREFKESIAGCDFVAMDMEMTGLYESKQLTPNRQDTSDERYAKLKRSVESYGVAQVGICLFTWVEAQSDGQYSGYYEAKPFNFNVFPCTSVGAIPVETHFGCKNTAFEFLARNGFDFNKWINSGIPYLRADEAHRLKTDRAGQLLNKRTSFVVDEKHAGFVRDFERALKSFSSSRRKTMSYETANSYERKIIYEVLSKYDTLGARGRLGLIEVFKGSKRAVTLHNLDKLRKLEANIKAAHGFCEIIDVLSAARKLVVGHNMPLDIMHAYSKFHRELPELRADFEQSMLRFLPILIDTKYIIESTPAIKTRYGTSNLDEIAPMLEREASYRSPPASLSHRAQLIRHHPDFVQSASQSMHEAGYDAYMTGATFIRLLKLEGGLDLYAISSPSENTSELVLYRYINKLYQATGDRLYWQLGGSDASRLSPTNVRQPASEGEGAADSFADNANIYESSHDSALAREYGNTTGSSSGLGSTKRANGNNGLLSDVFSQYSLMNINDAV